MYFPHPKQHYFTGIFSCVFFVLSPDELVKSLKMKATQKWRQQFDNYLKTMPVYYTAVSGESGPRGHVL